MVLRHPDFNSEYYLFCGASKYSFASTLSRQADGKLKLIAFSSRTLKKAGSKLLYIREGITHDSGWQCLFFIVKGLKS